MSPGGASESVRGNVLCLSQACKLHAYHKPLSARRRALSREQPRQLCLKLQAQLRSLILGSQLVIRGKTFL